MDTKNALRWICGLTFAGLVVVLGLSLSGPETVDAFHPKHCADVDGNGVVTRNDVDIVAVFFGKQVGRQAPLAPPYVDVTGNHVVDISDMAFVSGREGRTETCQNFFFGGPWDVNRDGFADITDVAIVSGAEGQTGRPVGDPKDLDRDSAITRADTLIAGGHFGEAVPAHPLFCADVDGNRRVDRNDTDIVAVFFGRSVPPAPRYADMNGDGFVDISDIAFVGGQEGTTTNCQTWFFGDPWDVNRDGFADITDVALASGSEGQRTAAGDPVDVDREGLGTRADTLIAGGHFGERTQY